MWGGGYWVNARTGPLVPEASHCNITAFFVPIDADGVEVVEPYRDSGRMAISTGGFVLKDVRLSGEYRLGEVGKGFYHAMEGFDNARLMIGASCAGVIRRVLDDAIP